MERQLGGSRERRPAALRGNEVPEGPGLDETICGNNGLAEVLIDIFDRGPIGLVTAITVPRST